MPSAIRVLVVDDSALMRTLISEMLAAAEGIEVAGIARTGVEAIAKTEELLPDVITLDVEMPELSGVEALRHIRRKSSAKVIMVSGANSADVTYEALSAGAIDFIPKPSGTFSPDIADIADELISKIRVAAEVDTSHLATPAVVEPPKARPKPAVAGEAPSKVVVIGASTGGPAAVERVMAALPHDLEAAAVVVQHLPVGFSTSFAKRLSRFSSLEIRHAENGDKVRQGVAYVAPAGQHMTIVSRPTMGLVVRLDSTAPILGVRPAADRTMESVAEATGDSTIGVLLTGMGSDGAFGMASIKNKGGRTIAQDEKTCVVYGMPRAAIERGVVDKVVPLQNVAAEIRRAVAKKGQAHGGH